MTPIRYLAAVALTLAATCSAFAADPVFPPGARVGMVPLVVNWDGQTFRDKLDLTTQDFYRRLRSSKRPQTPSTAGSW